MRTAHCECLVVEDVKTKNIELGRRRALALGGSLGT